MKTSEVLGSHCPDCGTFNDRATDAGGGGAVPEEGDTTVCLCGSALQFGAGMILEPVDWSRLDGEGRDALLRVQNAVLDLKEKAR